MLTNIRTSGGQADPEDLELQGRYQSLMFGSSCLKTIEVFETTLCIHIVQGRYNSKSLDDWTNRHPTLEGGVREHMQASIH